MIVWSVLSLRVCSIKGSLHVLLMGKQAVEKHIQWKVFKHHVSEIYFNSQQQSMQKKKPTIQFHSLKSTEESFLIYSTIKILWLFKKITTTKSKSLSLNVWKESLSRKKLLIWSSMETQFEWLNQLRRMMSRQDLMQFVKLMFTVKEEVEWKLDNWCLSILLVLREVRILIVTIELEDLRELRSISRCLLWKNVSEHLMRRRKLVKQAIQFMFLSEHLNSLWFFEIHSFQKLNLVKSSWLLASIPLLTVQTTL